MTFEKFLAFGRAMIPRGLFRMAQPIYHRLLSFAGAVRYNFPSRRLVMIGVTGTKGKTTTAQYLTSILEEAGIKTSSLSSLRFRILDKERKNEYKMTMPGRFVIQKFLREAADAGATHCVLEVTSEGIRQFRHKHIQWHTLVFTNLAPEHIESHGGYDNYRRMKGRLFTERHNVSIVNADDKEAEFFLKFPAVKKIKFGIKNKDANVRAEDVELKNNGAEFVLAGEKITIDLPGEFNVYNALAAAAVALDFGVAPEKIRAGLASVGRIPGRMEEIKEGQPFRAIVDYAHTPDSLRAVYKTLKSPDGRLIAVLGAAGGGRDKWKRPEFGKIAAEYADEVYLTNEDPYDEDPQAIIEEIAAGYLTAKPDGSSLQKILDRHEAIRAALKSALPGDTVVITGKGAESVIMGPHGTRLPWDDRAALRELIYKLRRP